MVDKQDLGSCATSVWVRVPPPALLLRAVAWSAIGLQAIIIGVLFDYNTEKYYFCDLNETIRLYIYYNGIDTGMAGVCKSVGGF